MSLGEKQGPGSGAGGGAEEVASGGWHKPLLSLLFTGLPLGAYSLGLSDFDSDFRSFRTRRGCRNSWTRGAGFGAVRLDFKSDLDSDLDSPFDSLFDSGLDSPWGLCAARVSLRRGRNR